jgi:hypothetical protein
MIKDFVSLEQLSLWGSTEHSSDFEDIGAKLGDLVTTTCICNEPLMYIHVFMNKFTKININVGSVCNNKYCIVSKNDPKYVSTEKKIKLLKEKERERKEGLPEGHFDNERKKKKEEKEKKKKEAEDKKRLKKEEKEEKLENKRKEAEDKKKLEEEKLLKNGGLACVLCIRPFINNDYSCSINRICGKCSTKNQKHVRESVLKIIKQVQAKECAGCEQNVFFFENNLCKKCGEFEKLTKCLMYTCDNHFICDKESQDLYCNDCDKKVVDCLSCTVKVIHPAVRCYKCEFNVIHKQITKYCDYCGDNFNVKEEYKWKTHCVSCFKLGRTSKRILKTCEECKESFAIDEKYKTNRFCVDCYYKKKKY